MSIIVFIKYFPLDTGEVAHIGSILKKNIFFQTSAGARLVRVGIAMKSVNRFYTTLMKKEEVIYFFIPFLIDLFSSYQLFSYHR